MNHACTKSILSVLQYKIINYTNTNTNNYINVRSKADK